ncbi:hypothetical protein ACIHEJ_07630 [Streptomyces sp. NPDC052301]|uniref:lipase/acyltransferase domain-containing protein n=1 Tax=Streptomyces sp. NPDC052301 TaxID=3365687 RepID=UPI0037D5F1DD
MAPRRRLHDAVVVVPGIMGSELIDSASRKVLWGAPHLFKYTARMHADRLRSLAVTEDERAGRTGRIKPGGLLSVHEWLPDLGGLEPYSQMVGDLRKYAVHPHAVVPFPYDWRLSVRHNANLLAVAAHRHLERWRSHRAHGEHMRNTGEDRPAQLLFVAHSMGGLLVRELFRIPGAADDVRAVLTAGTPFHGSVKSAVVLASGQAGAPWLPKKALREAGRTMPGLYDLLPSYRCVWDGDDTRRLTVSDITALGGDADLVRDTQAWQAATADTALRGHSMVVGVAQPTPLSLRIENGRAVTARLLPGRRPDGALRRDGRGRAVTEDGMGDGTVFREAAATGDATEIPVARKHGSLMSSKQVRTMAVSALSGLRDPGERGAVLGGGEFGLDAPEAARPGEPFTIRLTGADDPSEVHCTVEEVTGADVSAPTTLKPDRGDPETMTGQCALPRPGLYRIEVTGGLEPVSHLVMAVADDH